MARIEHALRDRLVNFAGLAALVGNRVFATKVQQGAVYPAVTYQRISGGRRTSLMGSDSGLVRPRFQVTAWAKPSATKGAHEVAGDVATQVRLALERFSGTVQGVEIQDIYIDDDTDLDQPETDIAGVATDVLIWHREAVA